MDVLSIDFDIIMAPVIEYYNNMVPRKDWEQIQNENPGMITPKADLHHFNFIIQLLEKHLNNTDNLYIAFNHKKIIDFLENEESFSIINIDHHHDLGYEPLDEIVEETLKKPNCGNWAKYLFDVNKLNKYIWIKNINSIENYKDSIQQNPEKYQFATKDLQDSDTKEMLLNIKFDKIFLCLSPEWVPPYYRDLFFGMLDWLNLKFNCHLEIQEGG